MNGAKKRYKQKVKRFTVEFYPTEKYLFEHLSKQDNKQGYIKQLIREDMIRNNITCNIAEMCGVPKRLINMSNEKKTGE